MNIWAEEELADLTYHWGEAYNIAHLGPETWVAQRRDSHSTVGAKTPSRLLERIRQDYRGEARAASARGGGRVTPPDAPPWGDQVVRLETFLAAHPDFGVMTPLDTRSVWWKAIRSGEVYAVENDLRLLLDRLERMLADP